MSSRRVRPLKSKNGGAEQGDTFGPAETGVTLASLGRGTRREVHAKQAAGELPWATADVEGARGPFDDIEITLV